MGLPSKSWIGKIILFLKVSDIFSPFRLIKPKLANISVEYFLFNNNLVKVFN